jgi:hypothetical protein
MWPGTFQSVQRKKDYLLAEQQNEQVVAGDAEL